MSARWLQFAVVGRCFQRTLPQKPHSWLRQAIPRSTQSVRSYASRVPTQAVEPTSVRELVAFKAKITTASAEDLAPLREAQNTHQPLYARIHIHNWSMLVTKGDTIKLPVNMKDLQVGDVLRFDQCSELGSRNCTLSGERLDPQLFTIKGVVTEKSRVKRTVAEKTRRRRRHVRHVVSNNSLTVIRVSELELSS